MVDRSQSRQTNEEDNESDDGQRGSEGSGNYNNTNNGSDEDVGPQVRASRTWRPTPLAHAHARALDARAHGPFTYKLADGGIVTGTYVDDKIQLTQHVGTRNS